MSERIAAAVWVKPRRRFAFCSGVVAFLALVVAFVAVMSGASSAAPAKRRTHQTASAGQCPAPTNAGVNRLLREMTVAEKFGQLEMAGPDGPNGTPGDLISEARSGQIGSVLDLTGVDQINQVQRAALQSRLHIPLIFGTRRDPRLPHDVPGAARRGRDVGSHAGGERRGGVRG